MGEYMNYMNLLNCIMLINFSAILVTVHYRHDNKQLFFEYKKTTTFDHFFFFCHMIDER